MNLNIINELAKMSKEKIEESLNSLIFNENEAKMFQKYRELIDEGFNMTLFDSHQKVFDAAMMYYVLKYRENIVNKKQ